MGSFLSTPNMDTEFHCGEGNGVKFACGSVQGWRKAQEDAHVACADLLAATGEEVWNEYGGNGALATSADDEAAVKAAAESVKADFKARLASMSAFGVFDGHGGKEVARFVASRILGELVRCELFRQRSMEPALVSLFHRLDDLLVDPGNQEELAAYRAIKNPSDIAKAREEEESQARAFAAMGKGASAATSQDDSSVSPRNSAAPVAGDNGNAKAFLRRLLMSRLAAAGGKSAEIERALERLDMSAAEAGKAKASAGEEKEGGKGGEEKEGAKGGDASGSDSDNGMVQFATDEEEDEDDEEEVDEEEASKGAKVTVTKEELLREGAGDDEEENDEPAAAAASSNAQAIVAVPEVASEPEAPAVGSASIRTVPISSVSSRSMNGASNCLLPNHQITAGCTAVFTLLDRSAQKLYVANAGDSRAVLCRGGEAMSLTKDHKPNDDVELNRIEAAGGFVSAVGRVNNNLNLSRAIGDLKYKQVRGLPASAQLISAEPDVTEVDVDDAKDEFVVLACDGVWDVMTNQDICDFVRERLVDMANKEGSDNDKGDGARVTQDGDAAAAAAPAPADPFDLQAIIADVFEHCVADNIGECSLGSDNMTCIIVLLDGFRGRLLAKDPAIVLRRVAAPSMDDGDEGEPEVGVD